MTRNSHILLVEDDSALQALIEQLLIKNNYIVSRAGSIEEAKKMIKIFSFDLILLDIMLPDSNGLIFYEEYIKDIINSPVIFLSALSNADDRVAGLELGAEDYVGKPFDSRELLLKIKKNLSSSNSNNIIVFNENVQFDLKKEKLTNDKLVINLTSNEIKILKLLIKNSKLNKSRNGKTFLSSAYSFQNRDVFSKEIFQLNYTWQYNVGKKQKFQMGLPGFSQIKFVSINKSTSFENKLIELNDLFLRNTYSNQFIWQDWKLVFEYKNQLDNENKKSANFYANIFGFSREFTPLV